MRYSIGLDLSLSGTGIVVLLEGTDTPYLATCIKPKKLRDGERLSYIKSQIAMYIERIYQTDRKADIIVAVEGYSYGSKNRGLPFQIGELGGVIREYLHKIGLSYQVVPPTTLKKWSAGTGKAKKEEIIRAVKARWGFDTQNNNIADAYCLAQYIKYLHKRQSCSDR